MNLIYSKQLQFYYTGERHSFQIMLPAPTPSLPATNFSINANDTVNANYNECIFKHIFTTKILANIQPLGDGNPANPATNLAPKIYYQQKGPAQE
jgi:hypothetical protein